MRLEGTDFKGAMKILRNGNAVKLPEFEKPKKPLKKGIEIVSCNDIISEDIFSYTDTRCISRHLIKQYCKQVSFRFPMGKRPGRIYTSCGFPTDSGSFELRDSFFKVSSSPKSISTIKGDKSRYILFEGFMDFLSALVYFEKDKFDETVIVLNSLSFIGGLVAFLESLESVDLYLDRDKPADEKIKALQGSKMNYIDKRFLFSPFSDFNEFLVAKNCGGGK
jgi:hypothetical protein